MNYLLDTNVVSELRKGPRADGSVRSWLAGVTGEVFLSSLVLGELRRGVELIRRRDPDGAATLEDWLDRIAGEYHDRILGVDRHIAEEWGRLNVPDPLPVIDGLQAATAKVHGLVFVTRNTADVERTGIELLNPFA